MILTTARLQRRDNSNPSLPPRPSKAPASPSEDDSRVRTDAPCRADSQVQRAEAPAFAHAPDNFLLGFMLGAATRTSPTAPATTLPAARTAALRGQQTGDSCAPEGVPETSLARLPDALLSEHVLSRLDADDLSDVRLTSKSMAELASRPHLAWRQGALRADCRRRSGLDLLPFLETNLEALRGTGEVRLADNLRPDVLMTLADLLGREPTLELEVHYLEDQSISALPYKAEGPENLHPYVAMNFGRPGLLGPEGLRTVNGLPLSLYELDLRWTRVSTPEATRIGLPPKLRSLALYVDELGDINDINDLIGQATALSALALEGARYSNSLLSQVRLPPSLRYLILLRNRGIPDSLHAAFNRGGLAALRSLTQLHTLALVGNAIQDWAAEVGNLPSSLRTLNLTRCSLVETAGQLSFPARLERLNVNENALSNAVTRLDLPSSLVRLALAYNDLSESVEVLQTKLATVPGLRELDLRGNRLGEKLTALRFGDNIRDLDLSANGITRDTVDQLTLPPRLRQLSLRNNEIGNALGRLALPSTLRTLDLTGNRLGRAALLLELPRSVRRVSLGDNGIDEKTLEALREKHPHVKFVP